MFVYRKYLMFIISLLFILTGCSVIGSPKNEKSSIYDVSSKAQAVEVDTDDNGSIDIDYGGTNGTNASTARANLGAAASGANSDITSLQDGITVNGVNYRGKGTVASIPGSPSSGDIYIVTDGDSKCDTTTGSGSADPYFIYYNGASWDCVGDGTTGSTNPDDITGDSNNDNLIDEKLMAGLSHGQTTAGSLSAGQMIPVDGMVLDPAGRKIVSGPDTVYAFVDSDPDTITDTGSGFVTDGFVAGMRVTISGSAYNDKVVTIDSVAAGTLTLIATDELTAESAGETVTLTGGNHYFVIYGPDETYRGFFDEMGRVFLASLQLPGHASNDAALTSLGDIFVKGTEDAVAIHGGANGEVQDEAVISLLDKLVVQFDPVNRYDNTTNHVVHIARMSDPYPNGFTMTQWYANYVNGDPPTTQLDADIMCDCTPDWNPADDATVMDVIDTTSGSATADSGFDSATCANGCRMYIRMGADPVDDGQTVVVEIEGYRNED